MKIFNKIVQYIDTNYANPDLNVNRILKEFSVCYTSLYEKFYFHLNMSPQKYLETKRLEFALDLLMKNEKIIHICYKSGYSNMKTFRTAFRKRFNKAPLNLQESLINEYQGKEQKKIKKIKNTLWD